MLHFCTTWQSPFGAVLAATKSVLALWLLIVRGVSYSTEGVVSSRMAYPGRLAAAECQTVSQSVTESIPYTWELFLGGRCKGTRWLLLPPFLLGICRSVCKSRLESIQAVTECMFLSHFLKHSISCRWFLLIYLWN